MDNTIIPLAEAAGIMSGETVNVLMFNEGGGEFLRTLTEVYTKRENGHDWLMVKWPAKGDTPWGTADCGYSGWLVDDEFKARLKAMANTKEVDHGRE